MSMALRQPTGRQHPVNSFQICSNKIPLINLLQKLFMINKVQFLSVIEDASVWAGLCFLRPSWFSGILYHLQLNLH